MCLPISVEELRATVEAVVDDGALRVDMRTAYPFRSTDRWYAMNWLAANDLAEKVGIAQARLSQIEAGKREGTTDALRKLATALGVAIDDLVP